MCDVFFENFWEDIKLMQKGCQIVKKKICNLSIFSVLKKNCRFRHNFDLFFAVGNIYFY